MRHPTQPNSHVLVTAPMNVVGPAIAIMVAFATGCTAPTRSYDHRGDQGVAHTPTDPILSGDPGPPGDPTHAGDSVGIVQHCATLPCWLMPDSRTVECVDPQGAVSPCPPNSEQDGQHQTPAPTYTIKGREARDALTGLTWWVEPSAVGNFETARDHCVDVAASSGRTFRLPTFVEAVSLLDLGFSGDPEALPAIDTRVFPGVTRRYLWTTDTPPLYPGDRFHVSLEGRTAEIFRGAHELGGIGLCVDGPPLPHDRFFSAGGSIVDSRTGLEWQNSGLAQSVPSWDTALDTCASLDFEKKNDWRLPTIKELATTVDHTKRGDALYKEFVGPNTGKYWSSTPNLTRTSGLEVLALDSFWGQIVDGDPDAFGSPWVRCVRGGPSALP